MLDTSFRSALKFTRGVGIAFAAMFLVLGTGTHLFAATRPVDSAASSLSAQTEAECSANGSATVERSTTTGAVRFVGVEAGQTLRSAEATASPEQAARSYLAACGSLFGIADAQSNLTVERERSDPDGRSMVRYQQTYNNVPILAGELIVNLDPSRSVTSVTGEALPDVYVDTQPQIDTAAAQAAAIQGLARNLGEDESSLVASEPTLWIYNPALLRPENGPTQLVWRMEVTHKEKLEIRQLVLVNAHRGGVALAFNQNDFAKNRQTYDTHNSTLTPGSLVCNESNLTCSGGDSHAVAAHLNAGDTYDFYLDSFGRDSINGAGMTIRSTVHYAFNYSNAFWNGYQIVYGDAADLPLADDIAGHELTHGVTQYESGLFSYYQSGAINESLSDVFGEFVDLTNGRGNDAPDARWLLGEDISGSGAIRNLQNPPAFGAPDKMTSPNYNKVTCGVYGSNCDEGGIHTNSGVNNKTAYLMVDGGNFNGKTISGLGIAKVAKIYYQVQTNLLTAGSDYGDLYNALYQACQNLVGTSDINSGDCQQVRNATLATEMNLQPFPGYNADAPLCPRGSPADVFFDDLESGAGNWVFSGLDGALTRWGLGNPGSSYYFPHSGTRFLYGDDFAYGGIAPNTVAALKNNVPLPTRAFLHFYHAYGFEDPNRDGGILEYSVNDGASWVNAGDLIQINGYDGDLAAGTPLGTIPAFISDSHGYISTRVNLATLAGQNVRFRWHLGANTTVYDRGWFLDDVRIYTCSMPTAPVTVTAVSVTNKNDVAQPTYKAGKKVKFHATLNNSGSACSISLNWKASKKPTVINNQTQNITVNPGNTQRAIKVKIPSDTPPNKYKLKVTSNCGGLKSSKSAKFQVVAP